MTKLLQQKRMHRVVMRAQLSKILDGCKLKPSTSHAWSFIALNRRPLQSKEEVSCQAWAAVQVAQPQSVLLPL
jgi:hypothetical protein